METAMTSSLRKHVRRRYASGAGRATSHWCALSLLSCLCAMSCKATPEPVTNDTSKPEGSTPRDVDDVDDVETPPAGFVAGPIVAAQLAQLANLTIELPDNLAIVEGEGGIALEAEGFPSVKLTHRAGAFEGGGRSTSRDDTLGKVWGELTTSSSQWKCEATGVGAHGDLVFDICKSMSVPTTPRTSDVKCEIVTGFDPKLVHEAWLDATSEFLTCFEATHDLETSLGFNVELIDRSFNFDKVRDSIDQGAFSCIMDAYTKLEGSDALHPPGLENGQIKCRATLLRD